MVYFNNLLDLLDRRQCPLTIIWTFCAIAAFCVDDLVVIVIFLLPDFLDVFSDYCNTFTTRTDLSPHSPTRMFDTSLYGSLGPNPDCFSSWWSNRQEEQSWFSSPFGRPEKTRQCWNYVVHSAAKSLPHCISCHTALVGPYLGLSRNSWYRTTSKDAIYGWENTPTEDSFRSRTQLAGGPTTEHGDVEFDIIWFKLSFGITSDVEDCGTIEDTQDIVTNPRQSRAEQTEHHRQAPMWRNPRRRSTLVVSRPDKPTNMWMPYWVCFLSKNSENKKAWRNCRVSCCAVHLGSHEFRHPARIFYFRPSL